MRKPQDTVLFCRATPVMSDEAAPRLLSLEKKKKKTTAPIERKNYHVRWSKIVVVCLKSS